MSTFKNNRYYQIIIALRPGQWIKNLLLFAAIIFRGELFNEFLFIRSLQAFIIFCALSSASYILNDIIDKPYDKKHPEKKHRPIASGVLSKSHAFEAVIILSMLSLTGAFMLRSSFFIISAGFLLLHILYSLYLKRFAILDILAIALSFVIRAFAGEVITGLHIPFWMTFTIIFISLFIASGKRRSEYVDKGATTRPALKKYREKLLDFYVSTFATATIIAYSLFTFIEGIPKFSGGIISPLLATFVPELIGRKWLIISVPFVIMGVMRYAQLIYERSLGEQPEKLVTSDFPLIFSILGWGLSVIFIIYII